MIKERIWKNSSNANDVSEKKKVFAGDIAAAVGHPKILVQEILYVMRKMLVY